MKSVILGGMFAAIGQLALAPAEAAAMSDVIKASGVRGGVAVHLGCGSRTGSGQAGALTVELCAGDQWLVYGLDTDASAVEKAKTYIASKGVYGQVSAEAFDGKSLPFGDNIVNLVVVSGECGVPGDELDRVLVPGGVLLCPKGSTTRVPGFSSQASGKWTKHTKPWPTDIDEWTHFLYGPANNAVSRDKRVGKPEHVQWFAGPEHSRDHDALASMSAMTTSGGRVFYIYDEGPVSVIHQPADWKLIARDAFNGKLLWKRDIPDWMTHLYNFRAGPVQLTRRLVSIKDEVFVTLGFEAPVQKLDAATGETLMTYEGSDETEELIVHDGTLLLVTGDPGFMIEKADGCVGYWEQSEDEEATISKRIIAYDAESGRRKWMLDRQELKGLVPLSLCAQGKRVFYLDDKRLHCLNAEDGKELWATDFETKGIFIRAYAPTVGCGDGSVYCLDAERGGLAWRFKTSALERRVGSEDRLESPWRINGAVLILNGTVYFSAGRSSHLDGGIKLYGVDLRTGEKKYFTELKSKANNKAGYLADMLSASAPRHKFV